MEHSESNPGKPTRTVLVVDDERLITDTLALILAQSGYRSFGAYNGRDGLQRAREIKPDMVLTGFKNRDGPNGIEMAIQIQKEMPETRILLFSGVAATVAPLLEDARAKGYVLDLVAKSVMPRALLHWCEAGGNHDVRSCQWCLEQRVSSGGAYPHGERRDCTCPWCRALSSAIASTGHQQRPSAEQP